MNDKSILQRLEGNALPAPRISLSGNDRAPISDSSKRYEIRGELARGGVGVVHKGHDNDLGRDVALKVLRDEHLADKEMLQRFVEEAQIGGQLQHPGIVPVYELGLQSDQRPFFAMKLVKGETLQRRLEARANSSNQLRELMMVFRDVCRTMSYAHARGVIHRDLKPSNVMIGSFGEVQVVDWGLAKVLSRGGIADERLRKKAERDVTMIETVRSSEGSNPSIAGSVMGTPAYMPPEQAMGRIDDLDERGDVFSLGAILCEILTGQPPYTGDASAVMAAAKQAALDEAIAGLNDCSGNAQLVKLCRHCLEPLRKNRPANAEQIADAVAAWLTEVEGKAHRAELQKIEAEAEADEQVRGRRQQHRVTVGVIGVAVLAIAVVLWINHVASARERTQRVAIDTAIERATRLVGAGAWDEALTAVELAAALQADETVLAGIRSQSNAGQERDRVEAEDVAFLAELDAIRGRLDSGTEERLPTVPGLSSRHGAFMQPAQQQALGAARNGRRGIDASYSVAFENRFGSVEASIERLRSSRHAEAFAANLGFWCWLRKTNGQPGWEAINDAARQIDPSHATVRDALISGDADQLLKIAEQQGDGLPLALAAQVGLALSDAGRKQLAVVFLQRMHLRAPSDFWINMRLGYAAKAHKDHDVAARHYTSALALRPLHNPAWAFLGSALFHNNDLAGAIDSYHRALDRDPGNKPYSAMLTALEARRLHLAGKFELAADKYAAALAEEPALTTDIDAGHRYHAACCAVRVGGQTSHAQALKWLQKDLEVHRRRLPHQRGSVHESLSWWKQDNDLAAIRDVPDVPAEFVRFWADVDALLGEASK